MSQSTDLFDPVHAPAVRRPRARRVWRMLGLVALSIFALMLAGATYETVSERADARRFLPAGQLIDVGGYRLHLNCLGQGKPVVVIDAGWGDWSLSWSKVQLLVSKTTTVCTYDRAGMGQSDAGPLPRDAAHFASELHTLLHRAKLDGPYVLVGHSLGGLPVRVFTGRYRTEVQGVVLIDSMAPDLPSMAVEGKKSLPDTRTFSWFTIPARLGLVRLLAGPLGLTQGIPAEIQAAYLAAIVKPRHAQTIAQEGAGMPASLTQASEVTSFGDLPLVVLSRGLNLETKWQAKQKLLLELSANSEQVTAKHSDHNIELEEPEAAVSAIARVISRLP
jgi:pimeloyl-ACP methyl ester carboxylesterase